jgi:hypothetical protein
MEKNSNPYGVTIGEVWVENDPRVSRKIRVIEFLSDVYSHNGFGYVQIKDLATGKTSRARLDRFNGRRGGYSRAEKE